MSYGLTKVGPALQSVKSQVSLSQRKAAPHALWLYKINIPQVQMSALSLPSMESHDLFETGGNRGLPIDAIGTFQRSRLLLKTMWMQQVRRVSSVDNLSMHCN